MINSIVLLLIIVVISYGFSKFNKRGGIYSKAAKSIVIAILIAFAYLIFIGPSFRLSSYSAARANVFIEKEHELIGMIELDKAEVYVFYDSIDDRYRSALVEDFLIGYRSNMSAHYYPHFEDDIRTIGGMNISTDEVDYCTFMVINQLTDISSIALINNDGEVLASTPIEVDEEVTLIYEPKRRERWFDYELVALDDDGVARYYYGYEHGDNHLSDDEYKWYSF